MRTIGVVALLLLLALARGASEDVGPVEVWPVAVGPPRFGEQPWVRGNIVVWQRYHQSDRWWEPDTIEYRDIGTLGGPIGTVTTYPASSTGVFLGPTHLFWGNNSYPPVRARPIRDLASGEDLLVSEGGEVIVANDQHVFIWFRDPGAGRRGGRIYAKAISDLGNASPETLRLVVVVRKEPNVSRVAGASSRYFVWEDVAPGDAGEVWKIFARRMDFLFAVDRTDAVIETDVPATGLGVHLDLAGSVLVLANGFYKIEAIDLDRPDSRATLAEGVQSSRMLDFPGVSEHYIVWTELIDFFERWAYFIPLVDGMPSGPPSVLTSNGGTWLMIDRNIAVWNGVTDFNGGDTISEAIVAAELPLPGATDCGDVDQDGRLTLSDAIIVLDHLFRGGARPRRRLADANLDGSVNIADAVDILRHLFAGDRPPCDGG